MTDNALVIYESPEKVRADLAAAHLEQILPARIDHERFLRVVAKAVIENPKLMACTRLSLLAAFNEAAQLGLEPSGLLGSAYIVPYKRSVQIGSRWHKISEAKLIPGYRGLIDLARRSGEIDAIEAEIVWRRDGFRLVKGTHAELWHEPFVADPIASPEERDPGPMVGAYMKATLRGGHEQYEWMSFDQIEAVRRSSRAADDGPWITHHAEMSRKTVVRRGAKYLPLSPDFQRALELDEEAERNAEPLAPATPPARAAQILLDRAAARSAPAPESGPPATASPESAPDASPGESGAPEPSETVDPEAELPVTHDPGGSPPIPAPAKPLCGELGPEGIICGKAAGHAGSHRSADHIWPRAKAEEKPEPEA